MLSDYKAVAYIYFTFITVSMGNTANILQIELAILTSWNV